MDRDLAALQQSLYDMAHIFHVIGKEFSLLMETCDDENTSILFENGISELKSVEKSVSDLLYSITENRDAMIRECGADAEFANAMRREVENLENATKTLLSGNKHLVSEIISAK